MRCEKARALTGPRTQKARPGPQAPQDAAMDSTVAPSSKLGEGVGALVPLPATKGI